MPRRAAQPKHPSSAELNDSITCIVGWQIPYRFDNGPGQHHWKTGIVLCAPNEAHDGPDNALVQFDKSQPPIAVQLWPETFGDGSFLDSNWFQVVDKASYLSAQFEAYQGQRRDMGVRTGRSHSHEIGDGHCGRRALARQLFQPLSLQKLALGCPMPAMERLALLGDGSRFHLTHKFYSCAIGC